MDLAAAEHAAGEFLRALGMDLGAVHLQRTPARMAQAWAQMLAQRDGYSLVPLSLYFKNARVKVEVGVAKGKKLYDKRESSAKSDAKREIDRAMKTRNR